METVVRVVFALIAVGAVVSAGVMLAIRASGRAHGRWLG